MLALAAELRAQFILAAHTPTPNCFVNDITLRTAMDLKAA
jgi:hypothetical protein